ncbi:hypothetical protein [Sporosarcina sp. NPDC096371]|uniref:hypothetical protein n=1 Tax=Sporosarcina sp. NPDC096371 TaxID=3364530 RepID=UPI0037F13FA9
MYILKHHYVLVDNKGILSIKNELEGDVICAFKSEELQFERLEKILYTGFSENDFSANHAKEYHYVLTIKKKFPKLFDFCQTVDEKNVKISIRKNFSTFRSAFISNKHFNKVERFIERYAATSEKFKVLLIAGEDRFNHLYHLLEQVAYVDVDKLSRQDANNLVEHPYELVIVDLVDYDLFSDAEHDKSRLLIINIDQNNIEVGPIIFNEQFLLPKLELASTDNFSVQMSEEALLFFFVQRILFIVLFELYNEIMEDIGLPLRNKFTINKLTLEGSSTPVVLYPKLVRDTVVASKSY